MTVSEEGRVLLRCEHDPIEDQTSDPTSVHPPVRRSESRPIAESPVLDKLVSDCRSHPVEIVSDVGACDCTKDRIWKRRSALFGQDTSRGGEGVESLIGVKRREGVGVEGRGRRSSGRGGEDLSRELSWEAAAKYQTTSAKEMEVNKEVEALPT